MCGLQYKTHYKLIPTILAVYGNVSKSQKQATVCRLVATICNDKLQRDFTSVLVFR